MQNHYHPTLQRSGRDSVPGILGLTASPVVRSSKDELKSVESVLMRTSFTNPFIPEELNSI
jgi:hypothetical protein